MLPTLSGPMENKRSLPQNQGCKRRQNPRI